MIANSFKGKDISTLKNSGEIQRIANNIENQWIGNRVICDFTKETSISDIINMLLKDMKFYSDMSSVYMRSRISDIFGPGVKYSIYTSFGRGSSYEVNNTLLSSQSELVVRNLCNAYGNEKFNLAIRVYFPNTKVYGVSLASVGSSEGIKGDGRIQVIVYTDTNIYIDDASKYLSKEYIDILTEGLSL